MKYKIILKYTYLDLNLGNAHDWQYFAQSNSGTHTEILSRRRWQHSNILHSKGSFRQLHNLVVERPNKHITLTQK